MASRTKQKEEARARRLAEEQARAERDRRARRVRMLSGMLLAAVAVVAVLIALSLGSSSKGGIPSTKKAQNKVVAQITSLLGGIPQSGNTIGNPTARVTVTEFGDLECPVCQAFTLSTENSLISSDVRAGKVKLVYRSLDTATGNGPNANYFGAQQAAALAAGLQNKAWYYIELFYHEQGQEGTTYVNAAYLDGLAQQVPGLNYAKWRTDSQSSTLQSQVTQDENFAAARGYSSTPTITIQGPKGSAQPIVGDTDYGTLETAIKQVA